ncbi:phosphate/phosphite/phosphonate ABC transporter substrate-binding protein [Oxynema sp. CENA135]|uniref:phosphate/phosphite/phosphonate ABC transporter substrate-binding protein n=1 Tax=Oxynema sp. CENA135 TaxID=984206 RepID=UPI00190994ED|nr:phosphate/phosphite/phosphonate ABC transporter substrate-binding protein [Oxynema sp. CENA135]MBK4732514.1 phosphate/phosphite/phosphonate ABC transporter substrate-binding protein [Oxynema sp. CENA135]
MKRRSFIGYFLLFLAGCSAVNSRSPEANTSSLKLPEKLRFAVTDVQGIDNLQRDYEVFRQELEIALNIPIEFFPVDSYTASAIALQNNKVDLVLTGPAEYVLTHTRTNAIPVIAITRPNYRSAIAISGTSQIKSLADLKGKKIAMLKLGSTSGHLGPTKFLIDAGLDPKTDYEVVMLGREGSLDALKQGTVDAWGGPIVDYEQFLKSANLTEADFPLLKRGDLLPSDVFMVNSYTPPATIDYIRSRLLESQEQLIEALSTPEANAKYKNSQLVSANDADYDPIREVYRAIGQGDFLQ